MPPPLPSGKKIVPLVPYDPKDYNTTPSVEAIADWRKRMAEPGYVPPHLWGKAGDPSKPKMPPCGDSPQSDYAEPSSSPRPLLEDKSYEISYRPLPPAQEVRPRPKSKFGLRQMFAAGHPVLLELEKNSGIPKPKSKPKITRVNPANFTHRPAVTACPSTSAFTPFPPKKVLKFAADSPPQYASTRSFMEEQELIDARRARASNDAFKLASMNVVQPPRHALQATSFSQSEHDIPLVLPWVTLQPSVELDEKEAALLYQFPDSPDTSPSFRPFTKEKDPMAISQILNPVASSTDDIFTMHGPGDGESKMPPLHAIRGPQLKKISNSPVTVKDIPKYRRFNEEIEASMGLNAPSKQAYVVTGNKDGALGSGYRRRGPRVCGYGLDELARYKKEAEMDVKERTVKEGEATKAVIALSNTGIPVATSKKEAEVAMGDGSEKSIEPGVAGKKKLRLILTVKDGLGKCSESFEAAKDLLSEGKKKKAASVKKEQEIDEEWVKVDDDEEWDMC
ncbi:hypothetical protein VTL71DRAFT_7901 [Oculimacula yallundae]|uniref:Uncharacterized protein n=1 Tax=Oculimacula yallundae TaxID=86028 RepID=A0ABR4CXM4_9HELO